MGIDPGWGGTGISMATLVITERHRIDIIGGGSGGRSDIDDEATQGTEAAAHRLKRDGDDRAHPMTVARGEEVDAASVTGCSGAARNGGGDRRCHGDPQGGVGN